MDENPGFDAGAIQQAALRLLAEHPGASVLAAGYNGILCDMPAQVPLTGQRVLRTRLYDLVPADQRVAIYDGWRRVRQNGAATVAVRMEDGEPATMYFLDTRAAWGVCLAILVRGETAEQLEELDPRSRPGPASGASGATTPAGCWRWTTPPSRWSASSPATCATATRPSGSIPSTASWPSTT